MIQKNQSNVQKTLGLVVLTLLSSWLLSACQEAERANDLPTAGSEASLEIALKNSVERALIPALTQFDQTAQDLDHSLVQFCKAPNENQLQTVQQGWKNLALSWNQLAMYNFGPLNDDFIFPVIYRIESYRQRGIDYTASVRSDLSRFIQSGLETADYSTKTLQYVGLLPLEVALFEHHKTQSQTTADIVADFNQSPTKCVYSQAIMDDLLIQSNAIVQGWTENYAKDNPDTELAYQTLFLKYESDDDTPAINRLITAIQEHLDYLKKRKLEGMLDAKLSNQPYEQMLAGLEAIEALLTSSGENADYRIFNHMKRNGDEQAVETVQQNLATAKQAAKDQDRAALTSALGLLDGNFKREIPDGLSVTLGINFSDGD